MFDLWVQLPHYYGNDYRRHNTYPYETVARVKEELEWFSSLTSSEGAHLNVRLTPAGRTGMEQWYDR